MHLRSPGAYDSLPAHPCRRRHIEGGSVARAKQTDRAEARRRYRQTNVQDAAIESSADDAQVETSSPTADAAKGTRQARPVRQPQPAQAPPGLLSAFRP